MIEFVVINDVFTMIWYNFIVADQVLWSGFYIMSNYLVRFMKKSVACYLIYDTVRWGSVLVSPYSYHLLVYRFLKPKTVRENYTKPDRGPTYVH